MRKTIAIAATLCFAVSCRSGSPEGVSSEVEFATSVVDPWTTEQEVQQLREQFGFIREALLSSEELEW